MKLNSRVYCRSEREALWAAIFNPEAWKASLPDAQEYEEIEPNEYEMTVKVDFGPLKGNQTLKIIFSELDQPNSCNLKVESKLLKSMTGSYQLVLPDEIKTEDTESQADDKSSEEVKEPDVIPEETRTIFRYQLNMDMGNPMFNAIIESFKGKVESGFAEILGRLDNYALGATETTD